MPSTRQHRRVTYDQYAPAPTRRASGSHLEQRVFRVFVSVVWFRLDLVRHGDIVCHQRASTDASPTINTRQHRRDAPVGVVYWGQRGFSVFVSFVWFRLDLVRHDRHSVPSTRQHRRIAYNQCALAPTRRLRYTRQPRRGEPAERHGYRRRGFSFLLFGTAT